MNIELNKLQAAVTLSGLQTFDRELLKDIEACKRVNDAEGLKEAREHRAAVREVIKAITAASIASPADL